MFEYDYAINRNEGDSDVVYTPDKIPKKLPNLVFIEGPNSSGKSTLLHLISLGLWGRKKSDIAPALKYKMDSLMDTSYQDLSFEFKIKSIDGSVELTSEKVMGKKTIKVYESINGGEKKPISFEQFERNYNLIYDIPIDPTDRLKQLTGTIKDIQNRRIHEVVQFRDYITTVVDAVGSSLDPKRIQNIENQIKKIKQEQKSQTERTQLNINLLDLLKKFAYCKFSLEYSRKLMAVEKKIIDIEKLKKKAQKQVTKQNKSYLQFKNQAQEEKEIIENAYYEVLPLLKPLLLKEQKQYITLLERFIINKFINDLEIPNRFTKLVFSLIDMLEENKKINTSDEQIEEAKIWIKIIEILEEHKSKDIIIPALGKKISEFIEILEEENAKSEKSLSYSYNIDHAIELLTTINKRCKFLENEIFPQLKELSESESFDFVDDQDSLEEESEKLDNDRDFFSLRTSTYFGKCDTIGISELDMNKTYDNLILTDEIAPYIIYSEDDLVEKIKTLELDIDTNTKSVERKSLIIDQHKDEIKRLKKREPHIYQGKLDALEKIRNICQTIISNLIKYDRFITNLIKKKKIKSITKEEEDYYKKVSLYLGKRIKYLKHIDGYYEITSIDMINEKISTEEGKVIRFADMGTGQSQSVYLMGQLNVSDNRKIIALFDEIAMMDKKSLTPILTKLKELYNDNKLLLGIVVQMGQETNWSDLNR
ncbi:MAG: hypothetical protein ACTSXD_01520 [Candidatus Heimdallarchaeaceae archaeon]